MGDVKKKKHYQNDAINLHTSFLEVRVISIFRASSLFSKRGKVLDKFADRMMYERWARAIVKCFCKCTQAN